MTDLCAHGCGTEVTVEHADGRGLCRPCYDAETGGAGKTGCPTCAPVLHGPLAETPDSDILDFGDHPDHPDNAPAPSWRDTECRLCGHLRGDHLASTGDCAHCECVRPVIVMCCPRDDEKLTSRAALALHALAEAAVLHHIGTAP